MNKSYSLKPFWASVFGLIFVLLAFSVTPQANAAASRCESLLFSEVHYEVSLGAPSGAEEVVATLYGTGEFLGVMEFNYNDADRSLYIDIMSVMDGFKGRGVGSGLFSRAVLEHPEAVLIDATLAMDNFSAFKKALRITASVEAALRETPLYKMALRHGFSEIVLRDSEDPKAYSRKKDIRVTFAKPGAVE